MVHKMAKKFSDKDFDAQFDAFLKESLSSEDSINSAHLSKLLQPPKPREGKPWWLDDDEELNDDKFGQGLSSSGRNFLKRKTEPKHSTPVLNDSDTALNDGRTVSQIDPNKKKAAEKQKAKGKIFSGKVRASKASSISKDSLDDISEKSEKSEETDGHKSNGNRSPRVITDNKATSDGRTVNSMKLGAETLEEMKDKARFFQALENGEDSLDFGKMNRELSQTASGFGYTPDNKQQGRPNQNQELLKGEPKKPSLLSNVALMDSLESTLNTSTSPGRKGEKPETGEGLQDTLKTLGTGLLGTNTSQEILALQEAYRDVHLSPTLKPDDTGSRLEQNDSGPAVGPQDVALGPDDTGQDIGPSKFKDVGLDEPDSIAQRMHSPPVIRQKERTMEDIMREMRELQAREEAIEQADIRTDRHGAGKANTTGTSPRLKKQPKAKPSVSFQQRPGQRPLSPERGSPTRKSRNAKKISTVKSSGYGQRGQTPERKDSERKSFDKISSPSRVSAKPPSPKKTPPNKTTWSPAHVAAQKIKGTETTQSAMHLSESDGGVRKSQLMASVESFVHYIKDQFSETDQEGEPLLQAAQALSANLDVNRGAALEREKVLLSELKERERQWIDDQEEHRRVKAELENREREVSRKLDTVNLEYEEKVFKLKQDNFVLSAKVSEYENDDNLKRKVANGGSLEGVSKDKVEMLEKEVREQEQLMAGYQTENKRLYNELKAVQKLNKQTEERLFRENQKLIRELASLRSQLERTDNELRNKGVITSLAVQQDIAAGNRGVISPDFNKISSLEGEMAEAKEKQKESDTQIERLNKKLRWYAENQELLDKDVVSLKGKNEEINRLKSRIENLQSESGRKVEESKIRARERAADAKKIQDLERQVKEMEQILRRRHPNSIPTLMMAACAADMASNQTGPKSHSVQALESRVLKLETELSCKDDECNKLLRGMEQKFNVIKLQYEERICELEKVSADGARVSLQGDHPHTNVHSLERELEAVRDRYRKQIIDLTADVTQLQEEIKTLKTQQDSTLKSELKSSQDREREMTNKLRALQQELELREKSSEKVEGNLSKKSENTQPKQVDNTRVGMKKKRSSSRTDTVVNDTDKPLTPYHDKQDTDREYQPQTFTGVHISEVQEDNNRLRAQVDHLQLELHQQRVDLRKSLAETEGVMRRSREDYEDQIHELRSSHQKELQRVLTDQAIQHSGTRLAQLQGKVDSQEVMLSHLRSQLAQAQLSNEQVSVLKIREMALETQVKQITEELREARRNHTPEMRHFEALQEKVGQMERRHEQRETELQQLLRHSQQAASVELSQERDKWQKLLETKNQEVRKFQIELDSILGVLQELKRQGVVLSTNPFRS